MSLLEDLREQLNSTPHDFHLMAVYADALDECDAVYKLCPVCIGGQRLTQFNGPGATNPFRPDCPQCDGRGEVIDPTNTLFAEGYRALSIVRPVYHTEFNAWMGWQSGFPVEWWVALLGAKGDVEMKQYPDALYALDEAALKFAKLSAAVKEKILTTGPWATCNKDGA